MIVTKDSTDVTTYFKLQDPTSGAPETGLTITDLDMTYTRDRAAEVKVDATALAAVDSAHGDNKMIQVGSTNSPGLYRADWPDAAFATGVDKVQLCINGAAIDPAYIEVELTLLDLQTVMRGTDNAATSAKQDTMETTLNDVPTTAEFEARTISTAAADNLEAMYDGTGYADPLAPSTQIQVSTIAGGIAVRTSAESSTVTEGTETNTYTATIAQTGTEYIVTDDDNAPNGIDFYLQSDTGAKDNYPVTLEIYCRYQEGGAPYTNSCKIQAWCWNISDWIDLNTLTHATSNQTYSLPLNVCTVGQSGADEGKVKVRYLQTTQESGSAVHIDYQAVLYRAPCLTAEIVNAQCDLALSDYDGPTNAEMEARTIVSADYVVVGDTIAGVTLCTTCTTNTDMKGTNSAALASTALSTAVWTGTKAGYLDASISGIGGAVGSGGTSHTITIDDGTNPIDNVRVWISTDSVGSNVAAGTLNTNASGEVAFMLDLGVTYYCWKEKSGYNFTNPESFTV